LQKLLKTGTPEENIGSGLVTKKKSKKKFQKNKQIEPIKMVEQV
jgi:hypothetical protein